MATIDQEIDAVAKATEDLRQACDRLRERLSRDNLASAKLSAGQMETLHHVRGALATCDLNTAAPAVTRLRGWLDEATSAA